MEGKICIVTGSNTGIGKETARGLAQRGATVILACRNADKAAAAVQDIRSSTGRSDLSAETLDLASMASIDAFARRIRDKYTRLDVLVNNAGIWPTQRQTTADGLEATFGVNHVGTHMLTLRLLPLLEASAPSRVVVLSSKLHYRGVVDWEDLQMERRRFNGPTQYSNSKLMNVLFTKALARRVAGKGVNVNAVHPGVVATELARNYPAFFVKIFHLFTISPAQGAQCSLHVATSPELAEVSGEYFESSRAKRASAKALDEGAQERLWELTESLIEARTRAAA
ncbi:MAG: SDR family oxidoreductase [Polyangiaceae bacterium]